MKLLNGEWYVPLYFAIHIVVYAVILATIAIFVALIIKYLGKFDIVPTEELAAAAAEETDHLVGENKPILFSYGTYDREDLEPGNDTKNHSDDKICIICYDAERNCFFVPCGHCATCQSCADRIVNEESKRCPICRRLIGRVRKNYSSYKSKLGWLRTKVLGDWDDKSKSIDEP